MIHSIGQKLFLKISIVFILVVSIVIAGQISASIQKKSSDQIVIKYSELNSIQEFKSSLQQLIVPVNNYVGDVQRKDINLFKILLLDVRQKYNSCKNIASVKHSDLLRSNFERMNQNIEDLENYVNSSQRNLELDSTKHVIGLMASGINVEVGHLSILLNDIKREIDSNIKVFDTTYKHSSITRLLLGILTILTIVIGGHVFSKSITNPIYSLVNFTKKISQDDLDSKIEINTNDELNVLADSFNSMILNLKNTTVSRNYLDDILKSMFNALIVTDEEGSIKSVNESTASLFEYDKEDLVGQNLTMLIGNIANENENPFFSIDELIKKRSIQNTEIICKSKTGKEIHSLYSCSVLTKNSGEVEGVVIVMSDLAEKKSIERKLERIRKEKTIAINEAQEEERLRIAIELHDGLGQLLTAISYFIQNYFIEQLKDNQEYHENLNHLQTLIDYAIIEAKDISHDLIPIALKDFGLKVAIKTLIDQANQRSEINFNFEEFNFDQRVDVKLEKALYRICQEAVNNQVKHSKAENANFQIIRHDDSLVLLIDDDGVGFEETKAKKNSKGGIGLMSMKERVAAFNGTFTISSELNKGTEILIEVPCQSS